MNERVKEVITMDPKYLDAESLRVVKIRVHEIFKPYLPYKAKNGIGFNSNGVSITTREGLIFADNYGMMNNTYAFMLRYSPTFSNEHAYTKSCKINAFDETALEAVSKIVEESINQYANKLANQFS